jgi:hypothetical protein
MDTNDHPGGDGEKVLKTGWPLFYQQCISLMRKNALISYRNRRATSMCACFNKACLCLCFEISCSPCCCLAILMLCLLQSPSCPSSSVDVDWCFLTNGVFKLCHSGSGG